MTKLINAPTSNPRLAKIEIATTVAIILFVFLLLACQDLPKRSAILLLSSVPVGCQIFSRIGSRTTVKKKANTTPNAHM